MFAKYSQLNTWSCLLLIWLLHCRPKLFKAVDQDDLFTAVDQDDVERLKQILTANPDGWVVKDEVSIFSLLLS